MSNDLHFYLPFFIDKNSTVGYFTLTKEFGTNPSPPNICLYYHIQDQNAVHQFRLTRM